MSPRVQQKRAARASRPAASGSSRGNMLFYASFSAGLMALLGGFVALMSLVGFYVIIVWPLTFWDLANLHLERYSSLTGTIVASVFAGGSLAGFWYFSGATLPFKRKASVSTTPRRSNG
ncbi:MAG: hypothetical protein WCF26_05400 [Candidatus Sulfotelmatobacter sp.]